MGGLGYVVPAMLTKNTNVTDGAASLTLGGMFQGAIHGWLIAGVVGGSDVSSRTGFGLSAITGAAESVIGFVVGSKSNISEGAAGAINTSAFYGMITGGALGLAIVGENAGDDLTVRLSSGLALAGAAGGVLFGNAIASSQRVTPTDATVYGVSGLLGATLPISMLALLSPDDLSVRLATALTAVGTVGGIAAGLAIIKGVDYPSGDGTGMVLGALAGGLIGLGVGVLTEEPKYTPIIAWGGAAIGFGLAVVGANPIVEASSRGSLKFDFNPLGLFLASRTNVAVPVGSLTYRF